MMIILNVIVGIILVLWGLWEFKDGKEYFRTRKESHLANLVNFDSILLTITLVSSGLLFIFRIFRIEYFI